MFDDDDDDEVLADVQFIESGMSELDELCSTPLKEGTERVRFNPTNPILPA